MDHIKEVTEVLTSALAIGERAESFNADTPLFGSLPELDSMAVVAVVNALEDRFDITVEGDELSADIFTTVGSLAAFVSRKLAS